MKRKIKLFLFSMFLAIALIWSSADIKVQAKTNGCSGAFGLFGCGVAYTSYGGSTAIAIGCGSNSDYYLSFVIKDLALC